MSDPMAEIRASFFVECEELLEALQDGLQTMYDGAGDDETVNIVFRAVHSIKGGAGAFGLDNLVAFAHRFETAMDDVRAGRLAPNNDVLKLFFSCGDTLADLVRESRDDIIHDESRIAPIVAELEGLLGDTVSDEPEEKIDFTVTPMTLDLDFSSGPEPDFDEDLKSGSDPVWKIDFKPKPMLYANGNEPQFLFRSLRDLGEMTVNHLDNDLPRLSELDPEHAYTSWEISLTSTEDEGAITEAFDFVEGLCDLNVRQLSRAAQEPLNDEFNGLAPLTAINTVASMMTDVSSIIEPDISISKDFEAQTVPTIESLPQPNERVQSSGGPATPRATVRVDLDRIDRLVNLVGEIVINQAMLSQSVEAAGIPPNSPVKTGLEEFQQLTRDIQESVMMIRAQPVKSLFQRMSRIVREASAVIGKDVRLRTDGENTEVDKTVIERLADPLTHMIRNAVDHGLESNDQRVASGKPREGNVHLTALHRSGRVVIEVSDDGAGINRPKVLAKAIERSLVPPDAQLSDAEIDNLLFLPGFSTADQISNLSGRGVGMDVVRSAIQSLGGRITIQSEKGQGTTFSISLPLTLAVLDGMVVRVAGETLVVPLSSILETLALTRNDLRTFGPATHVIEIRESFVPLIDLGAELGYREPLDDYSGGVVLLIGQEDGLAAAVVVDTIEDQRQVVIKGLQDSYGRVPGIAAATILGDGQIALILDPVDLVAQATGRTKKSRSERRPQLNKVISG